MTATYEHTSTSAAPLRDGALLSLRHGAVVESAGDRLSLVEGHVRSSLPVLSTGVRRALDSLAAGPVDEDSLFATAMTADGDRAAMALRLLLRRLDGGGWLEHTAVADGRALARLVPLGHVIETPSREVRAGDLVRLSRFAVIRRDGAGLLVESPLSTTQVRLVDPVALAVLGCCVETVPVGDLPARVPGLPAASAAVLARLLVKATVLQLPDEAPDNRPSLRMWAVPDLLFHARSRVGRNEGGYGGTYKWEGVCAPAPAVRPPFASVRPLPRLDLDARVRSDPPFGAVVRARRSVRAHDDEHPITRGQLAELLQRVALVESVFHDGHQELSKRPVPSGGALYELEIYPLVNACDGLDPGLYHYDAGSHGVARVAEPNPKTLLLAEYARRTGIMDTIPQVVLLIAARFERAMWKYESMAYALTLKHVGVLYESLYLTATAMGLACCGLGGGNSDAFALASGLDCYQETTVGEFLVGSRPRGDALQASRREGR